MGVACGQGDWGVDGCMFLSDGLELVGCFVDGMDVKSPSVVYRWNKYIMLRVIWVC